MSDLVGNPEDRFSRVAAQVGSHIYHRCSLTYFHVYFKRRYKKCSDLLPCVFVNLWPSLEFNFI